MIETVNYFKQTGPRWYWANGGSYTAYDEDSSDIIEEAY